MVRTVIKLSGVLLAHFSCFEVVCALDPITCLFDGLGNGGGSAARARRFKCRRIQLRFSPCLFIVQVQCCSIYSAGNLNNTPALERQHHRYTV